MLRGAIGVQRGAVIRKDVGMDQGKLAGTCDAKIDEIVLAYVVVQVFTVTKIRNHVI